MSSCGFQPNTVEASDKNTTARIRAFESTLLASCYLVSIQRLRRSRGVKGKHTVAPRRAFYADAAPRAGNIILSSTAACRASLELTISKRRPNLIKPLRANAFKVVDVVSRV